MGNTGLPITNLVLEGGGVKGIAYVGALEEIDKQGILDKIENVAGTSAGAITACLISLRYTAEEIKKIVFELDFNSFEDRKNPLRILTKYGIYAGDAFLAWITKLIQKKNLGPKATFSDFQKAGCRNLKVFGTDLYTKSVQEFSVESTPDAIVAEAVRASMSIPLFFKSWKFSNSIPNDHIYVDGGVLLNFPINTFNEKEHKLGHTIGLHLDNLTGDKKPIAFGNNHVGKYVRTLFDTLLKAQVVDFENNPEEFKHTIRIDDLGVSATDFGFSDTVKNNLIAEGSKATKAFFSGNGA
jgi:NTE family protein